MGLRSANWSRLKTSLHYINEGIKGLEGKEASVRQFKTLELKQLPVMPSCRVRTGYCHHVESYEI